MENLAAKRGWKEANRRYLSSMQEYGVREMLELMEDLGISEDVSAEEALELIETAVAVYITRSSDQRNDRRYRAAGDPNYLKDCPTYARIEQADWHGLTACGSWHRRQGWYQALGISALDSVVAEKKWGDVACTALIQLALLVVR